MATTESPLNLVRGPARKVEWAQLIRVGGDRVAILFDELRKLIGRIDGVVQRLNYSAIEERWLVQYEVGDAELVTVRISPGVLEACVALSRTEVERLLQNRTLTVTVRRAIQNSKSKPRPNSVRFLLSDRCAVRSLANLARAKCSLISDARRGIVRTTPSRSKTVKDR